MHLIIIIIVVRVPFHILPIETNRLLLFKKIEQRTILKRLLSFFLFVCVELKQTLHIFILLNIFIIIFCYILLTLSSHTRPKNLLRNLHVTENLEFIYQLLCYSFFKSLKTITHTHRIARVDFLVKKLIFFNFLTQLKLIYFVINFIT